MAQAMPGESTGEETLRNADVAMYWAKDRGKGTIAVYEAGLHAEALERLALRGELQRAIRDDQLVLHYQPTVDLQTQRITGFEALVRWNHPLRGLLPPSEFIPVAEQSGLVVGLGSWVLREACRAGALMQADWRQPTMAVNVSAQQLTRDDFVDEVVEVLRATRMPAERLVLEITESTLLDDMEGIVATLARLRDRGVRVAIDDFGTGYSSLSYLAQLPVDVLKVDKTFVDRVVGPAADTSLVEAILTMSRSMRLTTVAEGVEQPEQAAWLQQARCSMGQGFLWSQPVDLFTAREMLAVGNPRHPARAASAPIVSGEDDGLLALS
jgi:EAL domain-containing protein (putative c-di-GMP-specific phosphodiesterase class I)